MSRSSAARRAARRLNLEALETRLVLASSVTYGGLTFLTANPSDAFSHVGQSYSTDKAVRVIVRDSDSQANVGLLLPGGVTISDATSSGHQFSTPGEVRASAGNVSVGILADQQGDRTLDADDLLG